MTLEVLEGKVAVVTGAASGIGRALVARLAGEGMRLVLADVDGEALGQVSQRIDEAGGRAVAVATDVGDAAAVDHLADEAYSAFGAVHLLCNNAGVFAGGFFWECDRADFEWTLRVNLWGIVHGVRSFVPRMIEGGEEGHVVNTASNAGLLARPLSSPYTISKFAAVAASECLAHDLAMAGSRIGVSVLCPGSVQTDIGRSARNRPPELTGTPTSSGALVEQALLDRTTNAGQPPEEVAAAVLAAVRSGEFLVTPRPFGHLIRDRMEALVGNRLPDPVLTDD